MIKTFRGLLNTGEEEKIRLSTKKGKIGYRIIKFDCINNAPGAQHTETVMKIFKVTQITIDGLVDMSDGNLLAVCYYEDSLTAGSPGQKKVIFEQEVFNQDIFITYKDVSSETKSNYYLELETVNLTDNAAAVSTLRDIRLNPQVGA